MKEIKKRPFNLPVEVLRSIFENCLCLDSPIQVLLKVCRQWRVVALETQTLWRRVLLSADVMPLSFRAGSVHACATEGQAEHILKRSGSITKLEVTFVLGPAEGDIPSPETRATLFKTVGHTALHRISFLRITVNPEMTLPLVTASLHGVFKGTLPALESLMIASAQAIVNLYESLGTLMEIIQNTSMRLISLHLENVNKDFILRAAEQTSWSRLTRITIYNEFDSLNATFFSLPPNLEFFSFSGELVTTPPPTTAHDSVLTTRIEFPELKWLRVRRISMGTLARLNLPKLHTMAIDCVQENYPSPAPPPGTLLLPALKVLQIATVNPTIASIHAPLLDTLYLSIPALKRADADHVLKMVFYGGEEMMRPRHLTLRGPVHYKHLLTALRLIGGKLVSLELDSQVSLRRVFWQEMTPSPMTRGFKAAAPSIATAFTGSGTSCGGGDGVASPTSSINDASAATSGLPASAIPVPTPGGTAAASGKRLKISLLPSLRYLVVDVRENPMAQLEGREMRVLLLKLIEGRGGNEQCQSLLRLACKWRDGPGIEEMVEKRAGKPVAIGRPGWTMLKTGHKATTDDDQYSDNTKSIQVPNLSAYVLKDQKVFSGPYSTVYRGRLRKPPSAFERVVAIKTLRSIGSNCTTENHSPAETELSSYDRRFRRELSIWYRARHANVIPMLGYLEFRDCVEVSRALISEWADYGNAADYIDENTSSREAMQLLHDTVRGLHYLHTFKPCIVHGDIKPQNVLIGRDRVARLCDFGLSRFVMAEGVSSGLTTPTPFGGTPRYLAYEVVEYTGEKAVPTTATDVWAIGCIAFEFAYRRRPYAMIPNDGGSEWRIKHAISEGKSPAKRPENLGDALCVLWDLFSECWDTEPCDRPTIHGICCYLDGEVDTLSEALHAASQRQNTRH